MRYSFILPSYHYQGLGHTVLDYFKYNQNVSKVGGFNTSRFVYINRMTAKVLAPLKLWFEHVFPFSFARRIGLVREAGV